MLSAFLGALLKGKYMSDVMNNKDDILYSPNLDYDKNYDTSGSYIDDDPLDDEFSTSDDSKELLNNILKNIENIKQASNLFPSEIKELINTPLNAIEYVIGDIEKDPEPVIETIRTVTIKENEPTNSNEPTIGNDHSDGQTVSKPTYLLVEDNTDPVRITVNRTDKVALIKQQYEYDLVSIIDDYINKLNIETNKYAITTLSLMSGLDYSAYSKIQSKYVANSDDVSKDNKHLSDLIVRSQISKSMKARLYKKMFSIDKTITHLRMCKIGMQQRLRYYEESYQNGDSIDNCVSNKILENSRALYDARYKQNFINLYKYLNSSVILVNECMNMTVNEIQSKTILLKKEGTKLW